MPEISVIVNTFERPENLRRVLASLAGQRGELGGRSIRDVMEVVVCDDGSADETADLVADFAAAAPFPVQFTTHPRDGFQLAKSRNEGALAASADYLLFIDGDCLCPPGHVREHLLARRQGLAWAGYVAHLDEAATAEVDLAEAADGRYLRRIAWTERLKLWGMWLKAQGYRLLSHPRKPRMYGGDFSLHRADYVRVNGMDEDFRGWGGEDDDFGIRLRQAGVEIDSILNRTFAVHLWHPPAESTPAQVRSGPNAARLNRPHRLTRPRRGLHPRGVADLRLRIVGEPAEIADSLRGLGAVEVDAGPADIEILLGHAEATAHPSDCRIRIADETTPLNGADYLAAVRGDATQPSRWIPVGELTEWIRRSA